MKQYHREVIGEYDTDDSNNGIGMIHRLSWEMSSYDIVQFIESSLTKLRGVLTRLRFIKRLYERGQEK